MKTIFILIPHGYLLRNIVSTGIIEKLLEHPNIKIVVFTLSPEALNHLNYPDSRFVVEIFPSFPSYRLSNAIHRILRLRFEKVNENKAMKTLNKVYSKFSFSVFLFDLLVSQPFPKSNKIYHWLYTLAGKLRGVPKNIKNIFDFYKPDLVFSTNPTRTIEYDFLKYSRVHEISSIGMIKSWDTLLTKGYIPVKTDYYLTWNLIMKNDLINLHNINDKFIGVTGVPQFDIYSKPVDSVKRAFYFRELGLSSKKRTILFSTSTPWIGASEPLILEYIAKYLSDVRLDFKVQILVRLHPHDNMDRFKHINYSNITFQVPGEVDSHNHNERFLDPNYLNLLNAALHCSDLVINTASTISIEAAYLDKPIINLAFDARKVDYWSSCERFYEFEHYQPILNFGAVKLASSYEELTKLIMRYLKNPKLESHARNKLRESMCYRLDGKSAARVAKQLISVLENKSLVAEN